MTSGNGATLSYDALGRLYSVTKAGVTTRFVYDGNNLIAEYAANGTYLRRYVHGAGVDEPLVWLEGSGNSDRRWLLADERGSIVGVTNESGALTSLNRYDEYGKPGSGNVGRFQYTGQAWIAEVGIYHYKARAYHPGLGRFLQPDPIGYGDGMNLYAYVGGDPVGRTDPSGAKTYSNNGTFLLPTLNVTDTFIRDRCLGCNIISYGPSVLDRRGAEVGNWHGDGDGGGGGGGGGGEGDSVPKELSIDKPCLDSANISAALRNKDVQSKISELISRARSRTVEYGFMYDAVGDKSGVIFGGVHPRTIPNQFAKDPYGNGLPLKPFVPYKEKNYVYFHSHPREVPSRVGLTDYNFAKGFNLSIVAVDRAGNVSCSNG